MKAERRKQLEQPSFWVFVQARSECHEATRGPAVQDVINPQQRENIINWCSPMPPLIGHPLSGAKFAMCVSKLVHHQCLRQLSLPWNPLVVLRSETGGMSREGGPESVFRLACALEGAGIVVMDAGGGRMHAKARCWYAVNFSHCLGISPVAPSPCETQSRRSR